MPAMRSFISKGLRSRNIAGSVRFLLLATGSVTLGSSLFAVEPTGIAATRDTYKEYIEVRKLIGAETTSWATQQQTLTDMVSVITAEISELEERLATLEESSTSADAKRAELNNKLEASRATSKAFDATLADYEARTRALAKVLPEPLANELKPLMARIPSSPDKTRLSYSQRLQSIIGVLAQTDKFNNDIKYVSEVKTVGSDTFEVQTIYLGLAAALFTDAKGEYAGYGSVSKDGWTWETVSGESATAIAKAINVYLSRESPTFVSVPVKAD